MTFRNDLKAVGVLTGFVGAIALLTDIGVPFSWITVLSVLSATPLGRLLDRIRRGDDDGE